MVDFAVAVQPLSYSCPLLELPAITQTAAQLLLLRYSCLACMQDVLQAANADRLRLVQSLLAHGADIHAADPMV